jgi:hypothetical protein
MGVAEDIAPPDVIAFVACHLQGDEQGCRDLLAAVPDGVVLLGYAIETVVGVACELLPGGRAELLEMFTSWQERRRAAL